MRGALAEMRTLLFELRPSALEAVSLSTLLGHQGDAFTGRTRIPVKMILNDDSALPNDVKITFYRVAQEAFNNIAKHSEATEVAVKFRSKEGRVKITIADNGRGFDQQSLPEDKLGLRIMGERAEEVGARLEVESAPGEGARISLTWNDSTAGPGATKV
jgi:signal transduction histidine kinase